MSTLSLVFKLDWVWIHRTLEIHNPGRWLLWRWLWKRNAKTRKICGSTSKHDSECRMLVIRPWMSWSLNISKSIKTEATSWSEGPCNSKDLCKRLSRVRRARFQKCWSFFRSMELKSRIALQTFLCLLPRNCPFNVYLSRQEEGSKCELRTEFGHTICLHISCDSTV